MESSTSTESGFSKQNDSAGHDSGLSALADHRSWKETLTDQNESGVLHSIAAPALAHLLLIPFPAQAHIFPMLDLGHRLVDSGHGNIKVTLVSFRCLIDKILDAQSEDERMRNRKTIRLVGVPDRDGFNPPRGFPIKPKVLVESLQLGYNMEPFVDSLLHDRVDSPGGLDLQGPTCIVADLLNWWTADIATRLGIPRFVLSVFTAVFPLALLCHRKQIGNRESPGIDLPGLPFLVSDRFKHFVVTSEITDFDRMAVKLWTNSVLDSKGYLLNACLPLESPVVQSFREMVPKDRAVLAVGPLSSELRSADISMEGLEISDEAMVMEWLDQQPPVSVLFVSFGTTGMFCLSKQHVSDLAEGLDISGQRFIWVLRAPPDVRDIADALPVGFEGRVKGRALLLSGWAPQKKILAHRSTGGFLSACGWNSTIESLARGVPLIGWYSFADQPMVCRYTALFLKVTIELTQQENFIVEPEEIKRAVTMLFQSGEGRAMRERAAQCGRRMAEALGEGGSSHRAVREFVDLITSRPSS